LINVPNIGFIGVPSSAEERDEYHEGSLSVSLNQLLGREWSLGVRGRFTRSTLHQSSPEFANVASTATQTEEDALARNDTSRRRRSNLAQVGLFFLYHHPSGFFFQGEADWYHQTNHDSQVESIVTGVGESVVKSPDLPGDQFWQINVVTGYQFDRDQCEISIGCLNVLGQDYRLFPLNPYSSLPRDRTLFLRCRFSF
jgi:hypothetical protein